MFRRVAETIAAPDKKFDKKADVKGLSDTFYNMMTNFEFLPNSPTLMNAGRPLGQLSACFVLPVGDSMEEIFDAVKYTALIHKSGGGTGFSFSRLRPANDVVSSTTGISSGPLSFMRVFDIATETIKQGGTRRGANMGILRVDHPDIMDFIMCKADQKQLNNFNISVGLTENFMKAVERDEEYDLINPRDKKVVGTLNARKVFQRIVKQAWENGEPGIIFLDRLNRDNPTPLVGEIESTNPCGEQPLLPYESCNLGSINLGKFVKDGAIDWKKLKEVIINSVHFLDNVIEANNYPLQQIHEMTHANRKIGLGVMGWADMLILLGIPYSSDEAVKLGKKVMKFINDEGHLASQELAKKRGSFPNFKGSIFDKKGAPPMRNATVTTIAPTGTISIIANASSGVEPLFAVSYIRTVMDKNVMVEVNPMFEADRQGARLLLRRADEEDRRARHRAPTSPRCRPMCAMSLSRPTTSPPTTTSRCRRPSSSTPTTPSPRPSTSPTPPPSTMWRRSTCWPTRPAARVSPSTATAPATSRCSPPAKKEEHAAVVATPVEEDKKAIKRERPKALKGRTYQMQTGCGPLYITINEDKNGLFELFTTMGKAGGCAASQSEAIGRMVSLAWRSGVQARQVVKQLLGISCHCPSGFGDNRVTSCADAVAKAIQDHMLNNGYDINAEKATQERGACPECGGIVEHEGGCSVCHVCGYSECA